MFTDKELKTTIDFIEKKKQDILGSKDGSDLEYLKNMQTLIKLENACNNKLHKEKKL